MGVYSFKKGEGSKGNSQDFLDFGDKKDNLPFGGGLFFNFRIGKDKPLRFG